MEAKASFSSMMSMSVERLRLCLERSLGIARVGPMPIIRGATPAMVAPTNLARMGWLSSWARERRIRRMAAAIGKGLLVDGVFRGWIKGVCTSVCDLAGVATGASVAVLGESRADFAERFKSSAVARTLILG